MKAEVVSMTADNLDMEAIRRGGDILKQGGLVAFPTETVYGLGGDALNPQASMKIYAAKGRPSGYLSFVSSVAIIPTCSPCAFASAASSLIFFTTASSGPSTIARSAFGA